jgi:hypothetical protein
MGVTSCSGWMPQFVSKIAPPFVPRTFEMRDQSSVRFEWLADGITMQELEAAGKSCSCSEGLALQSCKKPTMSRMTYMRSW